MPQEIERKFLISEPPENFEKYNNYEIVQGYLIISEEMELRLRKKGNKFYQTIKIGSGLSREETEIEITIDQFSALWPYTEGKRVQKVRYEIEYNSLLIELDIYRGQLKNLLTAEVEFMTESESRKFQPPPWFGMEITDDSRYKNKNLVLSGIPI